MKQITTQPEPLHLPPEYNPRPGPVEYLGRWIPFLGWWWSSRLEVDRMMPAEKSIRDQLEARQPVPLEVWGDDPKVQAFAQWYTRKLQEQFSRRADRFIPDDPMEIVFFDDDLDYVEIIRAAGEELGFSKAWEDSVLDSIEPYFSKTLGEFIDYLVSTQEFEEVEIPLSMVD